MVIVVEGQIGVGKTMLSKELAKHLGTDFYPELGTKMTEAMLDRFYKDMDRWAFTLQIHFLNERFHKIKQIFKNGGGILDRSIYGDSIFAKVLNQDGHMSDNEYRIYADLLKNMLEHARKPTLLVYLKCSPETALKRIQQRNRSFEVGIDTDYLRKLNSMYEKWYTDYKISPKLALDTERYPLHNGEYMGRALDTIKLALDGKLKDLQGD